jgi:hypothetical protein
VSAPHRGPANSAASSRTPKSGPRSSRGQAVPFCGSQVHHLYRAIIGRPPTSGTHSGRARWPSRRSSAPVMSSRKALRPVPTSLQAAAIFMPVVPASRLRNDRCIAAIWKSFSDHAGWTTSRPAAGVLRSDSGQITDRGNCSCASPPSRPGPSGQLNRKSCSCCSTHALRTAGPALRL